MLSVEYSWKNQWKPDKWKNQWKPDKERISDNQTNWKNQWNQTNTDNSNSLENLKCKLCNFEAALEKGLNLHTIRKHTSINNEDRFKWDVCEFGGGTMEVHLGKCHMENFECGLCEYKAESSENLNLHLNWCEIYI